MKKFTFPFLLIILCVFSFRAGSAAEPAVVYFETPERAVAPGSEVRVDVLIDAPLPLNAYSISLSFSENLLTFVRSEEANSIITFWQTPPEVFEGGRLRMIGASPSAFQGVKGKIATLIFKIRTVGSAYLNVSDMHAYIADGKGTETNLKLNRGFISIEANGTSLPPSPVIDDIPPHVKFLALLTNPVDQNGKILSFDIADAETGINEVRVRGRSWLSWSSWENVKNPVSVRPGIWAIQIEAVDHAGNLTAQVIYYWPGLLKKIIFLFIPILALIIAFFFYKRRIRRLS